MLYNTAMSEDTLKQKLVIGGQAVIEGVMMKSPNYLTVAVRKKNGSIKIKEEIFKSFTAKFRAFNIPLLRGIINLFEMIVIGMKAINFSADEYAQDMDEDDDGKEKDGEKKSYDSKKCSEKKPEAGWLQIAAMIFSIILSFALALFLFKFIPLVFTEWLRSIFPVIADYYIIFNLIDGLTRIAIFILYIYVLSRFKSFYRIFEYHGAEHMAVHVYEKSRPLTAENVKCESPEHPRCGTSFILLVFIVSIIIFSLVPRNPAFWLNLAQRIAVIPLIAGVGYEILKWSTKRAKNSVVMKIITSPGLLTQKITTQKPDEKQIEVAIAALKRALELEKK